MAIEENRPLRKTRFKMSASQKKIGSGRLRMPLFHGILPLDQSRIWADLAAGVTLAAVGIPEVMGYTKIIETPVITGLYTMFLPVLRERGRLEEAYSREQRLVFGFWQGWSFAL
jgi:hypothetical protein